MSAIEDLKRLEGDWEGHCNLSIREDRKGRSYTERTGDSGGNLVFKLNRLPVVVREKVYENIDAHTRSLVDAAYAEVRAALVLKARAEAEDLLKAYPEVKP